MESVPPINRFLLHGHWILKTGMCNVEIPMKNTTSSGAHPSDICCLTKTVVTTVIYLQYHKIHLLGSCWFIKTIISISIIHIYIYLQLCLKFSIYSWFINQSLLQTIYRHMYICIYTQVKSINGWYLDEQIYRYLQLSTLHLGYKSTTSGVCLQSSTLHGLEEVVRQLWRRGT